MPKKQKIGDGRMMTRLAQPGLTNPWFIVLGVMGGLLVFLHYGKK